MSLGSTNKNDRSIGYGCMFICGMKDKSPSVEYQYMSICRTNGDNLLVGYACIYIGRTYEDDPLVGYLGNINVCPLTEHMVIQ